MEANLILKMWMFAVAIGFVASLKCYDCGRDLTTKQCYEQRNKLSDCPDNLDSCVTMAIDFVNKATGKKIRELYKACTIYAHICTKTTEEMCSILNSSMKADAGKTMTGCDNFTCCKTEKCNTYLEVPPTEKYSLSPWATDMHYCSSMCCGNAKNIVYQNRSCWGECSGVDTVRTVPCSRTYCNKLHCDPHYLTTPWATDLNLCSTKCCSVTPSQVWQNRSCIGKCDQVKLSQEIKCEDSKCDAKFCGAPGIKLNPLYMLIVVALISLW